MLYAIISQLQKALSRKFRLMSSCFGSAHGYFFFLIKLCFNGFKFLWQMFAQVVSIKKVLILKTNNLKLQHRKQMVHINILLFFWRFQNALLPLISLSLLNWNGQLRQTVLRQFFHHWLRLGWQKLGIISI